MASGNGSTVFSYDVDPSNVAPVSLDVCKVGVSPLRVLNPSGLVQFFAEFVNGCFFHGLALVHDVVMQKNFQHRNPWQILKITVFVILRDASNEFFCWRSVDSPRFFGPPVAQSH